MKTITNFCPRLGRECPGESACAFSAEHQPDIVDLRAMELGSRIMADVVEQLPVAMEVTMAMRMTGSIGTIQQIPNDEDARLARATATGTFQSDGETWVKASDAATDWRLSPAEAPFTSSPGFDLGAARDNRPEKPCCERVYSGVTSAWCNLPQGHSPPCLAVGDPVYGPDLDPAAKFVKPIYDQIRLTTNDRKPSKL